MSENVRLPNGTEDTASEPRLTVVVVTYNSIGEIEACLDSVVRSAESAIVRVVDNASTDRTADFVVERFPHVDLIRSEENIGFGAGANLGVRRATTPFVFLLNPDAEVEPTSLGLLIDLLEQHPDAAATGPLVLNSDGSIQPSRRRFPTPGQAVVHGFLGLFRPSNRVTRSYTMDDVPLDRPTRVDWLAANSILLRRDRFQEIGGFDERFFFFMEDVDLCKRLGERGWSLWFEPRAQVMHAWGASWTAKPLYFLFLHHTHMYRYLTKHYRGAWVLVYPLAAAVLAVRFGMMALRLMVTRRSLPSHQGAPLAADRG